MGREHAESAARWRLLGWLAVLALTSCRPHGDGDRQERREGEGRASEEGRSGPESRGDPQVEGDAARCPLGTEGCPCVEGRRGCNPGLECFGNFCYGDKVVKPKTYFYEKKQFDDVALLRARIMAALPLSPGMKVADIGAGHGWFSVRIAEAVHPGGRVYATDFLKEPLAFLQGFSAGMHHVGRRHAAIEPRHCSGDRDTALDDVPPGSVDLILVINSVLFLRDPKARPTDLAYLRKLVRLLRPGGLFVFHHDWVFPDSLDRQGVIDLLAEAGLSPQAQDLAMPAHMPAETFFEDKPGGKRKTLKLGFIVGLNLPGGEALQLRPAPVGLPDSASGTAPSP